MTATLPSSFPITAPFGRCVSIAYRGVDFFGGGRELLGSPNLLSIRPNGEAKLDPITDIFRTMHVTAFGQHRLEATAPWGVKQENKTEEKVAPSGKKMPPTDLAHFAMLSRGNCWLSVERIPEPTPLSGG